MRYTARLFLCALVLTPLTLTVGCGGDSGTASTSSGTAGTSAGGATSTGTVGTAGTGGAGGVANTGSGGAATTGTLSSTVTTGSGVVAIADCQGHVYQCGDLMDNDGDGLMDSEDPDCLGPCDNTEAGFYGGIPGQSGPACTVDCYFDQDSGSGNDDCHWNHQCDPNEVAPGYYPESSEGAKCAYNPAANTSGTNQTCDQLYNTQTKACHDYCGPLTPNGCDCFGCCELPAGKGKYVWLGSENAAGEGSCTLADINDPAKCQPCQPVKACLNNCEHCELCIGKTTLPADCNPSTSTSSSSGAGGAGSTSSGSTTGSGGGTQCAPGVQVCGLPGQAPCAVGSYCVTGCCQVVPK